MKKMLFALTVFVCLFLVSCGRYWETKGIFTEIEKEIKLEPPTVQGNIFSILEYDGDLYAGGGKVYRKAPSEIRGWSVFSDSPYGVVVRLAAGYHDGKEYLYALGAKQGTYKLFGHGGSGWTQIPVSGTIQTIFSNNAVSRGSAANNRAFVTTSEEIYELTENTTAPVSPDDTDNGALSGSEAAAYAGGQTYFSDSFAFTSDGTWLFDSSDGKIRYGNTIESFSDGPSISNATSLWACEGVLYIGTTGGAQKVLYDENGVSGSSTVIPVPGDNADAAIGSYRIGAIYARKSGERTDIYASTIGYGTTYNNKNNGLWGYYSTRDEWNRE
ncbi:MAG: hypothetical protein LBS97_01195 [Treponema sp.]|jgi:hypothetical protein|nr:hypothetical protein [Treponema sp.]